MENYRRFSDDYLPERVFYVADKDYIFSGESKRLRPVNWARDSAEWLRNHSGENVPAHIREQMVGPGNRVFTKKPEGECSR